MSDTQRNFMILGLIAVLGVVFAGPFGAGSALLGALFNLVFFVLIVGGMYMLYQRHSGTIAQMPTQPRTIMQASAAIFGITIVTGMATFIPIFPFGWSAYGGMATLLFFGTLFATGFGMFWAWGQRSSGW